MSLAAAVLAAPLIAVFLGVGAAKLLRARPLLTDFARFGYPTWSCPTTGAVEVVGALLLLVGIVTRPWPALAGAVVLIIVLVGALATHLRIHDAAGKLGPPALLLVLLGTEVTLLAAR